MWIFRRPHRLALALLAAWSVPTPPAGAQAQRPLAPIAEAVTVRRYPVAEGPAEAFTERREAAMARAVADVIGERGEPLIREVTGPHGIVRLVYRDALVVVTAYHSNSIVCRIDIAASRLTEEVRLAPLVSLAAQSCRSADVRGGGGRVEPLPIVPIGSETLPGSPGVTARFYATDQSYALFDQLVRNHALEQRTEPLLVRDVLLYEDPPPQSGREWRYAWFADGTMLAFRHVEGQRNERGRDPDFACAAAGPAARFTRLDGGAFDRWCDRHSARLRPGLAAFVAAVTAWRDEEWRRQEGERIASGRPGSVPQVYGGFHFGERPAALLERFWRTGSVASAPPPR